MKTRILVLGGAHIDRRGRIAGSTNIGASNPGSWFEEAGGGGFNAARNLAWLGFPVTMISPRGGDAAGETVSEAALFAGVDDRPFVFLDRRTPSYTAILENDGNLIVALADMDLYQLFSPRRLSIRAVRDAFASHDLILFDTNLPTETLTAIASRAASLGKPAMAIAISPAKVKKLLAALPLLDFLFMNEAEAAALTGEKAQEPAQWPALLRRLGLKGGVITRGRNEMIAFSGEAAVAVSPPLFDSIADVTGAGDSFAAGFISATAAGGGLQDAVQAGAAAAAITVQSPFAVCETLSPDLLRQMIALVPAPRILHAGSSQQEPTP